uniref:PARP-type domain-containing protein n=1 Tax=Alexandrium monilatum TaxID=311494 RepID=A0A7S4SGE2_9DINO
MAEVAAEGPKGDDPYKVELAKSNRSACKACKEKIDKGEVRFGSLVDMGGYGSYHWRHAKCITPKQAENVESKLGSCESLGGYALLTPGQKAQLCKVFAAAKKSGDKVAKAKAKVKAKAEAKAKATAAKKAKAKAKKEAISMKKAAAKAKKLAVKAKAAAKKEAAKAKAAAKKKGKVKAKAKVPARSVEAEAPAAGSGMPSEQEQHAFLDAAKRFDFDRVRDFVEENPGYLNAQPAGRWSALHQAAEKGDIEMVSYLVMKGASLTVKTKDGKTPLDVAADNCKALLVPTAKRRGDGPEPPPKRRAA